MNPPAPGNRVRTFTGDKLPTVGVPQILLFGHSGAGKTTLLAALMRAAEEKPDVIGGHLMETSGRLTRLAEAFYSGAELPPTESEVVSYTLQMVPIRARLPDRHEETSQPTSFAPSCQNVVVIHDCSGEAVKHCLLTIPPAADTPLPPVSPACWTERGRTSGSHSLKVESSRVSSLMAAPTQLPVGHDLGELQRVLQEADALVVLVAATTSEPKLTEAFGEFRRFLSAVQVARCSARKVGGFPVFLVLTQCDRLVRPGDSRSIWESRVQAWSERIYAAFETFLRREFEPELPPSDVRQSTVAERAETGEVAIGGRIEEWTAEGTQRFLFTPFGSLDLQVYAVAARYPGLPEVTENDPGPYHVAELFRDVFWAGADHRRRQHQADRRLQWTIRSMGAFLVATLTVLLVLFLAPPRVESPTLAEMVAGYREHEPPPPERLAVSRLTLHRQILERFRDHTDFWQLSPELQGFVFQRLREIEDYRALRRHLASSAGPADCRTLQELEQLEQALRNGKLSIPQGRGYDWSATEAGRWREKWLHDMVVIRRAEQQLQELYRDRVRRIQRLMDVDHFAGSWRDEANTVIQWSDPPFPLEDALPGALAVMDLPAGHGTAVTWFVPYHFEGVIRWRDEWQRWQRRLQALRDLADACGLTRSSDLPAPLRIPKDSDSPSPGDAPALRWEQLQQHYGLYLSQPALWESSQFPERIRAVFQDHRSRFLRGVGRRLRQELQRQLGQANGLNDMPVQWRQIAELLRQPSGDVAEWGKLLHVILLQGDLQAAKPLQELAAFLSRESFTLELHGMDVWLPPDLALEPPRPDGPLVLKWSGSPGELVLRFPQVGTPIRDGSGRLYIFQAEKVKKLQYYPGDTVILELPLRAGQETMRLVWEHGLSASYQFDRIHGPPRLIRAEGRMEVARGVRLSPLAGSVWPVPPPLWYALLNP